MLGLYSSKRKQFDSGHRYREQKRSHEDDRRLSYVQQRVTEKEISERKMLRKRDHMTLEDKRTINEY